MRDRLVVALVGMTVLMLALYGVPRAYLLADLVTEQETRKVARSVDLLEVVVEERLDQGREVDADYLEGLLRAGETMTYVDAQGGTVTAGPPVGDDDIVVTRDLEGGGSVQVSRDDALVQERISDALIPLIVLGLSLTAVAALFGTLVARRLSRPFAELAVTADRLSRARFDVEVPHYAMPEAEAIGAALRRASTQLEGLLLREREFASNASHQLRTPITALRLTLEDLSMWPETPPDVAAELRENISELDRLSGAINELLQLSRGGRLGEPVAVDLAAMLMDAVERWDDHVRAAGRRIRVEGEEHVPAHLVPGPVQQVLDVLVENACAYGEGDIVLAATHAGDHLCVTVRDAGVRMFGPEVFQRGERAGSGDGHGLGLTIAQELALSLQGRLVLEETATTGFVLELPRPRGDSASGTATSSLAGTSPRG